MLNGHGIDLADYLEQPTLVSRLNREELGTLLAQIKALEGVVMARLLTDVDREDRHREMKAEPDRMLTPAEAAELMRCSVRWIARHKATLPFIVHKSERAYACSERGVRLWLKQHQS